MHRILALVLIGLAASVASAQTAVVRGVVTDTTGAPLPGVNVYLSGTTRGTSTDVDGKFALDRLPPGAYRVVASMLGFAARTEAAPLASRDTLELAISLLPTVRDLGLLEVSAERDHRWKRRFAWFRRQLIGETENAAHCEILNPHVLTFQGRWGTLSATASEPLIIENRALGYRLRYDLETFEGSSASLRYHGDEHFDELMPSDSAEAARWARARDAAYRGSMRHLLRSLLAGTAESEGFSLTLSWVDPLGYRATFGMPNRPVSGDRIIRLDSTGWGTIRVRGQLGVYYADEPESPAYLESAWFQDRRRPNQEQHSTIQLRGRERIDPQGTPEDPFAFTVSGYMAFERLADLVPSDYEITSTTQ